VAGFADVAVAEDDEERRTFLGLTHYKGELHSHTGLTHDDDQTKREWFPTEVFHYLEDQGDLDFYGATEKAGRMDVSNADNYIQSIDEAESVEWRRLYEDTDAWNGAGNRLVVVPGQEVSWTDGTGHLNVFNAQWLLQPEATGSGWTDSTPGKVQWDLPAFYAFMKQDPDAIGQFNHPDTEDGSFDQFRHIDRQLDQQFETFEYKKEDTAYEQAWWMALDRGWHLAPTWNGDEHGRTFNDNPARTGIWATSHDLPGLYDAMHRRSMYATFDDNATLAMSGNGQMMGSILPASTTSLDLELSITDPDAADASGTVTIISNKGTRVATQTYAGADARLTFTVPAQDGDWFYAKVVQSDGDYLIGAPVWIGDTVRGADYAPTVRVADMPATVRPGERVMLPAATAVDDSGLEPVITTEVFTGEGVIPVTDGGFTVTGFDEQIIVVKATDAAGNVGSALIRLTVDQDGADPNAVFRHFEPIVNVGAQPGEGAISVSTDQRIEAAWAQILPSDETDWSKAVTVESSGRKVYDFPRAGREPNPSTPLDRPDLRWYEMVTGQVLRNHEFRMTGLAQSERYKYRFAITPEGPWTDVEGEFRAGGYTNEPIYILGDLQVEGSNYPADDSNRAQRQAEYGVFPEMLRKLEDRHPGGDLLVQLGDLVNDAGFGHQWDETFDWALKDLDLQYAGLVGNHETQEDDEHNTLLSLETNAIFSGIFANPLNGVMGESNYSFDRGDIHFAVINSMYHIDEQIDWLKDDMRATDKKWKVVLGHFSYFGGSHASDTKLVSDRAKIAPVIEQLGVDLYVGGHDHLYKRSILIGGKKVAPEEEPLGTAWVTMGSTGPKFYDNPTQPVDPDDPKGPQKPLYDWDDIVYDTDTQVGMVLQATDDGLRFDAYNIAGERIDEHVVTQPEGIWEISSADVRDGKLIGIGVKSYAGTRTEPLTIAVGVYDYLGERLLDLRAVDVTLEQRAGEQLARFDEPIVLDPRNTVRAFAWDGLGSGEPLQQPATLFEGILGSGTAEDPYQLRTAGDLSRISTDLTANYVLMNDIAFGDRERRTIAPAGGEPFTGVLDGQGYEISGIINSTSNAVGLFGVNAGTIRNLGVVDAQVHADARPSGILADANSGTIERVWTTGAVTGRAQIGGIVGLSSGTVRDSWSKATMNGRTRVGGIVGSASPGSVTERTWFNGTIIMRKGDAMNGGGVAGFVENGATARSNAVIGLTITEGKNGQGVTGQLQAQGVLKDNLVSTAVTITVPQRAGQAGHNTIKGEPTAPEVLADPAVYADRLGWDLDQIWRFDSATGTPRLVVEKG
jgi:large repetitive protein